MEKKSFPCLPHNMKPSGFFNILFYFLCENCVTQGYLHNIIKKLLTVIQFAVKNSSVFGQSSFEIVGIERFVQKQSIRFVVLLNVDLHLNIRENWIQNVLYMNHHRNWSVFFSLVFHPIASATFWDSLVCYFCNFFGIGSFVTKTVDAN